ncbi:BamA/TamA family outer membrane protein [Terrimonas pollutisoli]|uniref:BamA/TamA family outer membrane protein n=1 Tax=Terrimonas pollutisoli TaxID=3034147 RepID=UPI0023EB5026|nr:BamA/TamA family outer membrane protein [Terrimonas sp. H1YJ31]
MRYWLVFALVISFLSASSQADSVQTRVILVGDAGALVKGQASVLDAIKKTVKLDKKTVLVYLGDNLYDAGLPSETFNRYSDIKAALDSQINLIKGTQAKAYMIPGNHDWENGGVRGYEAILRQQLYVDQYGGGKVEFYPKGGCPGPVEVEISDDVVLVIMDSQWWIHSNDKPGIESDCEFKTEDEVIGELEDILNKNYKKLILLATHHPFKSNGPHGGYFTFKQHLFPFTEMRSNLYVPLPVLGSAYPIARSIFGTPQDIKHPAYTNMINRIMASVKNHPHVIMVAGHEHALQFLKDSSYNYIVSGSGCKTQRVSPGRKAEFIARSLGFVTLDVLKNKNVRANFYTVDKQHVDSIKLAYSNRILDYSKLPPLPNNDSVTTATYVYSDFVQSPASEQYKNPKLGQKVFNGNNYRKEWSTRVLFKVFNINKEKGGFKIDGVGGGKQTKSLKLIDKKGVEWTLRTIDKDPEKAIPENFRQSFASNIIQDMISAAHPYAPLVVPTLADTTGILVSAPEFFFVPDDPSLGYYKPLFANKICLLEKKDANEKGDSKSSLQLFNKMREDNDHTVDEQAVLRARLLDMLIADWDRHFDQWRWATRDTGQGKLYIPIPRDRDQAFFYSDGLIVKYAARRRLPFLKGLQYKIPDINHLNTVAKDFDRIFLNNIDENIWTRVVTDFTSKLTDQKIEQAVHKMPPEIYAISGKEIVDKLISRKKLLKERSLKYYKFLSQEVDILGSNENEKFSLSAVNDSIKLTVFSYRKQADTNFVMYQRVFDQKVTREIRLYGFNGEDKFEVDSNLHSTIRIRMIGGRGNDSFFIKSRLKTFVYDNTIDSNFLSSVRGTKKYINEDPNINEFRIRHFNYPFRRFPRLLLGLNGDDGLLVGTGFWFRNYGFRKTPFASENKLMTLFALTRKAFQVKYNYEKIQALGTFDLLGAAQISNPVLDNFFGFGNSSVRDKSLPKKFYRVRYKFVSADLLFRKTYFNKLSIIAGPTVFHYWNRYENNEDYILGKPGDVGLDSAEVYNVKTYAGFKAAVILDNLNDELFPTRGIRFVNKLTYLQPLNKNSETVNKIESDMVIYASLKIPARVVGVIKAGAGHIFNKKIEYFQALTLGQNNVLRGFRKNRFAGHSLAYGSLELRIKLFDSKSYIFPGQVGLVAFNDVGRVWYKGEDSKRWHYVAGGGFYYNPFNVVILSFTAGYSKEESVLNFSLGSKFNLTF